MINFTGRPYGGVITPAPPPIGGWKPVEAPVLQAKGLVLVWQDRLGEADAPADLQHFADPYPSGRYHHCDFSPPICNNRVSFVTYDGRPCVRVNFPAGSPGILNYRSQYLPNTYREFGICWDIKHPPGFNLRSQQNTNIYGKTFFGMITGHSDFHKPGVPTSRSWAGEVNEVNNVWGGMLGLNWKYNLLYPNHFELSWYPHVVGAYIGGVDRFRSGLYSNPSDIPGYPTLPVCRIPIGSWHRVEMYGRMDTNRRNGLLEFWVDGVLAQSMPNLDLGGWQGNRGITSGNGQLVGSSGGGWRFRGWSGREMLGGYTLAPNLIPQYGGVRYYHNLRVYGKV